MKKDSLKETLIKNLYRFGLYLLLGVFAGYLFDKNGKNNDTNYMVVSIILFLIIGLIDFLFGMFLSIHAVFITSHFDALVFTPFN